MLRNSLFPGIVDKRLMQVADKLPEKLVICEKEKNWKIVSYNSVYLHLTRIVEDW